MLKAALLCSAAFCFSGDTFFAAAQTETLWYDRPAANWNEALPVGNGRLGAMVFGDATREHIQLNEGNVWVGERRDRNNPEGYEGFVESRRLLLAGKTVEAQDAAQKKMIGVPNRMPQYQTLGDLTLDFTGLGTPSGYRRELLLNRAEAAVSWKSGEANCYRTVIASRPDEVIAIRVGCTKPGLISFSAALSRPADFNAESLGTDAIRMRGRAIPHDERHAEEAKTGVAFEAVLRAIPRGGRVNTAAGRLTVEGADSVLLLFAARTDLREKDPLAVCLRDLKAASRPWDELLARHLEDYQALYQRMALNLGRPDAALGALPITARIAKVREGGNDPDLAALYLRFARYLLIAGSRPGNLPETLQGLWNDKLDPAWDSKFTVNINTEMNYWPAEPANLSELTSPLFDLIDAARVNGRITAQKLYRARGFVIHHNTDIWGDTAPIDSARSGMWPMGGAWLSLHLWDHYDFTGDKVFLAKRGYPVLKEAAEFLLDYMTDDGQGHLVTGPSVSPENSFKPADGTKAYLTMAPVMDTEIARALFGDVMRASEILGVDPDFRAKVAAARGKLMPFRIGKYGQLQEWPRDYEEAEPGHRHISNLFGLYPDDQITLRGTPDLARAARTTLERRLASGGGSTGWSRAWIVSYWARLLEGELAWQNFQLLLGKSTLPNLFNNGPPFQIDGNFGGAAGVMEMILQSHSGEIAFLPALPAAWAEGTVRGMKARGAVELDFAWRNSRATSATLRPATAGVRALRAPKGQAITAVLQAGKPLRLEPGKDGSVSVRLDAGKAYSVTFSR